MVVDTRLQSPVLSGAAIQDLEAHLLGELIRPAHDDYASARRVQNLAFDRHPALIARAADAADVIRSVNFAREHVLPLAVRSGGHSMSGQGTVDGGLVIDMRRMSAMTIDPERRTAWVQPGLTWGAYAERANQYGLATSAGDTASVGVGGLTLGGGIGWMVRKHGLTIDNLLSAELVTADGRLVRASAEEHPDLFWALRGGGGNFGVATAFQFRLSPVGTILGGGIIYPATAEVLSGWAHYASMAPDELTTMVYVMTAPPLPFIPRDQHGKLVAILGLAYVGDVETGQRVVEPLRRLGTPVADLTAPMPYPAIFALTESATQPEYMAVRSGYMSALDTEILESITEHAGRMPEPSGIVQLRALGGAMARVPADATAFAHRDARFMTTVIGSTHAASAAGGMRAWAEELWAALSPHASGVYVVRAGQEFRTRARDVRCDGTVFDIEVLGRGFEYQGRFALLGVVRDVTDEVRAYNDLEERVAARTHEIERRRQVAEALSELLTVVNSQRALDEMLAAILAQAVRLLGSHAEALYLLDEHYPNVLRLHASRNVPPGAEPPSMPLGRPVIGLAAERRCPVLAPDLRQIMAEPPAATVEDQAVRRGTYLELVRRGSASTVDPLREQRQRLMSERFRTLLAVPLLARGNCHGSLLLAYRKRHVPSEEEFELIGAFAGHVGLAIESARLQAQAEQRRREIDRRRQVAEGLRDLVATVNSTRTLDEVLQEVAAQASRLLASDASAIYLPEDSSTDVRLRARAWFGLNAAYADVSIPDGASATGLAVSQRRSVAIYDVLDALAADPESEFEPTLQDRGSHLRVVRLPTHRGPIGSEADATSRTRADASGHRALLAVPLASKSEAYGALTLYFREAHEFDEEEVELATTFADQAALGIENARLHGQSERRRREMESLYAADERLYQSLRLDNVLQALVDEAARLLQAEMTSVLTWNDRRTRLSVRSAHGFNAEQLARMSFAPGEGISTHVAASGELVAVWDVLSDPRISSRINESINRDAGIRSLISVPIKLEHEIFGVFNVNSASLRSFGDEEQRLLLALAQRAAVAIQNARLHEESEARRQELEALYHADQALHRSLRLEEVLEVLIGLPVSIGQAQLVSLLLWDDQQRQFVFGGARGMSDDILRETFTLAELRIARNSGSDLVEIEDASSDTRLSDRLRVTVAREGVRAWISCPIRIEGRLFGSLSFGYRYSHAFTDRERRLVVALAQRAALAIRNARLHQESELQRDELEALYRADEALHRSLRLHEVLDALVDTAINLFDADGAGLWGPDPQRADGRVPLASRGLSAEYLDETVRMIEEPAVMDYWWREDSILVEDLSRDSRMPRSQRAALEREGYCALLSTRIRVRDEVFGSFTVGFRTPHQFTQQEQRLLTALARRAGVAIQNAQLYEQTQQAAALEERQRLARELHDAVTQTLFSTALIADVLPELWDLDPKEGRQHLADLRRLTRGALAEMRTLLVELRPGALTEMPLGDLLRQLAEATAGRSRLDVRAVIDGLPRPLPSAVQVALYRMAQEALNNVVKHAQAHHVALELAYPADGVRLRVTDDGCGFDQDPSSIPAGHLGLSIMRERADAVGADLEVASQFGAGTTIEISWRTTETP